MNNLTVIHFFSLWDNFLENKDGNHLEKNLINTVDGVEQSRLNPKFVLVLIFVEYGLELS